MLHRMYAEIPLYTERDQTYTKNHGDGVNGPGNRKSRVVIGRVVASCACARARPCVVRAC
jgi:hypothetical protein